MATITNAQRQAVHTYVTGVDALVASWHASNERSAALMRQLSAENTLIDDVAWRSAVLAELEVAADIAAEAEAEQSARHDLGEVEARLADARTVWQIARGAQRDRQERIKTQRAEIARASAAIRSAEKIAEREQTERSALVPA